MIEATEEMLNAFRDAVRRGGDSVDDIRHEGIQAVLDLIDPVPNDVHAVVDRNGDKYWRVVDGANAWRRFRDGRHYAYGQLSAECGPITWEG